MFGEEWKPLMRPIFQRLFMFCADPATWCPQEVIDMYRKKRQFKPPTP